MKISTLISCTSARTTLKNVGRLACGLFMALAFTLPVQAVDLLYATMSDGTVATFDVSSGNTTIIANSKSIVASYLHATNGLAIDISGNLFVSDYTFGTVVKISPGGNVSNYASGLNGPYGLAIDADSNLYAANFLGDTISKITPSGSVSTFATGVRTPYGLAIDADSNLYAANYANSKVSKITPVGSVETFATGVTSPYGLALDTGGNIFAANPADSTISKITTGGSVSTFATGLNSPEGLAFDSGGNLYVANSGSLPIGSISKIDSSGNVLFSFSTGSATPRFLAFGPTPVPEPSTYALAAIATGVMGVMARRRKARQSA